MTSTEQELRGADTREELATPRPRGLRRGRESSSDLLSPPPQRPVGKIRPVIRPPPSSEPGRGAGRQGPGRGAGASLEGPCTLEASPRCLPQTPRTPADPSAAHELVRPRIPHELLPLLNHLPAALLLFLDDHLGRAGRVPRRGRGLQRSGGDTRRNPSHTGTRGKRRRRGRGRPPSDMQLL